MTSGQFKAEADYLAITGVPLGDYVNARRNAGWSWDDIAWKVGENSRRIVRPSRETLRRWYHEETS